MNPRRKISRRHFVQLGSAGMAAVSLSSKKLPAAAKLEPTIAIPDDGWRLWPDTEAEWENDELFLPDELKLTSLPAHPPKGGWDKLNAQQGIPVTLPASVEQYYWGRLGSRPYTKAEYEYADTDTRVANGAYRGVSWFWRDFELPAAARGKQVTLCIRGCRQRVEVFVNRKLAGYDLIAETSYECDITPILQPGRNQLALRITHPGGVYDWRDYTKLRWGAKEFHAGRGFGGVDRGITLRIHDSVFLGDLWVLNTSQVTSVQGYAEIRNALDHNTKARIRFSALERDSDAVIVSAIAEADIAAGASAVVQAALSFPLAKLWSVQNPHLYRMRAELESRSDGVKANDHLERVFGFRWFEPVSIGSDAMLMLNGERIRMYSAIEFGTWGFNGLWPTPELARKGDLAAKKIGLNALQYHRNLGKHEELQQDDELGLLRYMEPGGGVLSFTDDGESNFTQPTPPTPPPIDTSGNGGEPTSWSQRYMRFRILRMIRDHRSHPSVVVYNLQNERNPDLHNPRIFSMLRAMHKADPSRTIVLHSGIGTNNQAFMLPYSDSVNVEDGTGYSGWSDAHTVGGAGVWQDSLYKNPRQFMHYSGNRREISMQGEMLGWAAPDNHAAKLESIRAGGGHSFDRADHERILSAYESFLDKWNFRGAFPTASALFADVGNKLYDTWGRILQVIRTDDASDFLVINGWEDQPIDSHSGLVDNQRNFKGDPALIRNALEPLRPVVQPRGVVHKPGDSFLIDLFLLNETHQPVTGKLNLTITDPAGKVSALRTDSVPEFVRNKFAYSVAEAIECPALKAEGHYELKLKLDGPTAAEGATRIFIVDPAPRQERVLNAGVLGDVDLFASMVSHGAITAKDFEAEAKHDLVIWFATSNDDPSIMIEKVRSGLPLLVLARGAVGADWAAKALSAAGAFTYAGRAGETRGCWMGTWVFVKDHPSYQGLPTNQVMKWEYQVDFRDATGLMVEGPGVDVFAGFGRDHDTKLGAATFTAQLQQGRILFQAIRGMQPLVYERFIVNAARSLCTSGQ
jgi:beta-galactosidase